MVAPGSVNDTDTHFRSMHGDVVVCVFGDSHTAQYSNDTAASQCGGRCALPAEGKQFTQTSLWVACDP